MITLESIFQSMNTLHMHWYSIVIEGEVEDVAEGGITMVVAVVEEDIMNKSHIGISYLNLKSWISIQNGINRFKLKEQ